MGTEPLWTGLINKKCAFFVLENHNYMYIKLGLFFFRVTLIMPVLWILGQVKQLGKGETLTKKTYTVETWYNKILGTEIFFYIRYFVISVVNYKQYNTDQINPLGPEKLVCYIRYFVIRMYQIYIKFPL